jgi:hypothetical protein
MDYILALFENLNYVALIAVALLIGSGIVASFLYKKSKEVKHVPVITEQEVTEAIAELEVEPEYPIPVVREDAPTVPRARRAPRAKKVIGEDGLEVPKDPATVNESGKKTKRSDKLRRSKEK